MTVQTISSLSSGTESSGKLLNSNNNSENSSGGLSFNATMNETNSNYKFDDQHYLLSDGQVLTADQLLEMLENGNSLPGMNLPTLSELQQYKFQAGLNNPRFQPLMDARFDEKMFQLQPANDFMKDQFLLNQQFNKNQFLKVGAALPDQFLVPIANNSAPDSAAIGFSAAYGYQLATGADGSSGLMSNSFSIATPVQHPQWSQSLGQSVQWMVNQNIQQANIKLNPPDLGMLDVRITVNNDQASVHFAATNSAVREALESAMPRLRDMLEETGISLADVNVSEHSLEHGQAEQDSDIGKEAQGGTNDDDINANTGDVIDTSSKRMQIGLLDTYA